MFNTNLIISQCTLCIKNLRNTFLQYGQDLIRKPGILAQPKTISWGWVGQNKIVWQIILVIVYGLRKVLFSALP